jgi:hypothetical protein
MTRLQSLKSDQFARFCVVCPQRAAMEACASVTQPTPIGPAWLAAGGTEGINYGSGNRLSPKYTLAFASFSCLKVVIIPP